MFTPITWFANNSVAANLLMILLLLGGLFGALTTNQEEFPNFDIKVVSVQVPYLGAAPVEVERAVCVRVEESIEGLEGIDKLRSTATEGMCSVTAELFDNADATAVLNEVKSRVDSINSFPVETEKPIVSKMTMARRVVQIAVSGHTDERTIKEIARELRDEIATVDGISQVGVDYIRPYEISIEVSELELRRYGITLEQVSRAISQTSLDMPGGSIKTINGEILIRSTGQAYWGEEFEDVVVVTKNDGTRVTLSEVATIRDTFQEGDLAAQFNGARAAVVNVAQVGDEDLIQIAEDVHKIVGKYRLKIPEGIVLDTWIDASKDLEERMSVLTQNAGGGLLLVLVILALFLKFRLAMWVAIGIPVALLGTLGALPFTDINISTMTVMAFILVLGIVVDDAIVVGERVYAHEQMGKSNLQAAVDGTWEVSVPVIFGVLTTIAAFLPLIMVEGRMSGFFAPIGWVVIFALACSIIESQLILPAHLANRKRDEPTTKGSKAWNKFQGSLAQWLEDVAAQTYLPFVAKVLRWRYVTAAVCLGVLILAVSLIMSGRVVFGFFPSIEGDRVYASIELPEGIAAKTTMDAARRIEVAAQNVSDKMTSEMGLTAPLIRNVFSSVGQNADRNGPPRPESAGRSNIAEIVIDLAPLSERGYLSAKDVATRWRDEVGAITDVVKLAFDADQYSAGRPIEYQLQGKEVDQLRIAAEYLKAELARYNGVFDITDSFRSGKQEIQLSLLPEARNLGLTLSDLASQVRSAFYGAESQRVQRGKDDVRVMVRFPEAERKSIGNLEDMYIRTPDGNQVPFYSVAKFEIGRGYSKINRKDGRRTVTVDADVNRTVVAPEEVAESIRVELIPEFMRLYPEIDISMGGEQEERTTALGGLAIGSLFSLVVIFGLLAIPLRSYLQPLVIMSVIPFGAVGAIVGHFVLGQQLMFFSALGIVALSGVVVNASLVLVDYANRQRREGKTLTEAILNACLVRFRPILLTSVTTFVGLIPLMSTSTPTTAPFLPMAISLAWGVLFATFITLLLVPCLYLMVEDSIFQKNRLFAWLGNKPPPEITDPLMQPNSGG
ncbi:MAG: efflux RND transporter permease subunit [Pseudomonadales bacterium]|nr:efflux RND transporter permease subunit [Pseudomonadales bacterium]